MAERLSSLYTCRNQSDTRSEQPKTERKIQLKAQSPNKDSAQHCDATKKLRASLVTQMCLNESSSTCLPDVVLPSQLIGKTVADNSARETSVSHKGPPDRQFTRSIRAQTVQGTRAFAGAWKM